MKFCIEIRDAEFVVVIDGYRGLILSSPILIDHFQIKFDKKLLIYDNKIMLERWIKVFFILTYGTCCIYTRILVS